MYVNCSGSSVAFNTMAGTCAKEHETIWEVQERKSTCLMVCVSAVCVWCVVVEDGTQGVTHVK